MSGPDRQYPRGVPGGGATFNRRMQALRSEAQGAAFNHPPGISPEVEAAVAYARGRIEDFFEAGRQTQLHTMPPAFLEPSYRSIGFDDYATVTLGAGAGFTDLVEISVGSGKFGVVRAWGQDLDDIAGFADVIWRIVWNGVTVAPYESVTRQLGTILNPRECMIPIPPNTVLKLQASNPGASAYDATGLLKGWTWPPAFSGSTGGFKDTLAD